MGPEGLSLYLRGGSDADRPRWRPSLPVAMAAKILYDAALELGRGEWKNRALCVHCQIATPASVASAALAPPEAVRAVRHLRGGA